MLYLRKNNQTKSIGGIPSAYPSSHVTYGDTTVEDELDEINSNLSAHTFGQTVNIPYDTDYIAPSDGYVSGYFDGSNINNFVIVKINGEQLIYYKVGATVNAFPGVSLYVKKGMVIRIQGTNGNGAFNPIV